MNSQQLEQVLKEDLYTSSFSIKVLPINHFMDEKFELSSMTIFNYDECNKPGSHWVAVFFCPDGIVEYFDSFAFPPLNKSLLMKIENLSKYEPLYNVTCLQSKSSVCGQFCLVYLLLRARGYHMNEIVSFFKNSPTDGDEHDHVVNSFINLNFQHLFNFPLQTHTMKFESFM